jgi:hypothetical protein
VLGGPTGTPSFSGAKPPSVHVCVVIVVGFVDCCLCAGGKPTDANMSSSVADNGAQPDKYVCSTPRLRLSRHAFDDTTLWLAYATDKFERLQARSFHSRLWISPRTSSDHPCTSSLNLTLPSHLCIFVFFLLPAPLFHTHTVLIRMAVNRSRPTVPSQSKPA